MSITMKASDTFQEMDILPFPRRGEFVLLDTRYSSFNEWNVERMLAEFNVTSASRSRAGRRYAEVEVHIKVVRSLVCTHTCIHQDIILSYIISYFCRLEYKCHLYIGITTYVIIGMGPKRNIILPSKS